MTYTKVNSGPIIPNPDTHTQSERETKEDTDYISISLLFVLFSNFSYKRYTRVMRMIGVVYLRPCKFRALSKCGITPNAILQITTTFFVTLYRHLHALQTIQRLVCTDLRSNPRPPRRRIRRRRWWNRILILCRQHQFQLNACGV